MIEYSLLPQLQQPLPPPCRVEGLCGSDSEREREGVREREGERERVVFHLYF